MSHYKDNTARDNMELDNITMSRAPAKRPEPARSATWPIPTISITPPDSPDTQDFQDDLEHFPDRHFLSPITYEERYGCWDSDSDDEDDKDAEWAAGITDFSLFTADRQRAIETGEPLDAKWDSLISHQAEAFERSCERVRDSHAANDELPELTPDTSPDLRDNLDDDAEFDGRHTIPQVRVPNYLTVEVKPSETNAMVGPDDNLPMPAAFTQKKRMARPGLRHARTMSGRKHIWRRPDEDIFTVGEDVMGEAVAEMEEEEDEDDEGRVLDSIRAMRLG